MARDRHQIVSQAAHVESADDNECNLLGVHEVSLLLAGLQQREHIK